jgi:hypothetical protein
MTHDW